MPKIIWSRKIKIKLWRISLFLLIFPFIFYFIVLASREIMISEVFYDPAGVDTGKEWIELWNNSNIDFNLGGYELNAAGDYFVFPNFTLGRNNVAVIHWNAEGINSDFDLYTGSTGFDNMGNTQGYVALFNSSTHNKDTIISYMEYGGSGNTWESIAVESNLWTPDSYAEDVLPGHSLELRYESAGNKGEDYSGQSEPTPGVLPVPEPSCWILFTIGCITFIHKWGKFRLNSLLYSIGA